MKSIRSKRELVAISIILVLCIILIFFIKIVNGRKKMQNPMNKNDDIQQVYNKNSNEGKETISPKDYNKIDLDYASFNLEIKKISIYINRIYKDNLFISIIDKPNQDPLTPSLYITPKLVTYNLKTKESNIIEHKEETRIWDYIINNNKIYFTTVEYNQNWQIEWKLISSDLNFDNQNILKSGIVSNGFNSPNIISTDNNIYVATSNEKENEYNFYQITDNGDIKLLYSIDMSKETINHFSKIYIDDESIYYMIIDNENSQSLCRYNYKSNYKEIIYSINDSEKNLFEFLVMDEFYVIDVYDASKKSKLIYIYKDGKIIESNNEVLLSFFRKLENGKILTHNGNKLFRLFNKNGLEEKVFEFQGLYPDFKYIIYDSRYMIITNNDPNELYIYDLNELQ